METAENSGALGNLAPGNNATSNIATGEGGAVTDAATAGPHAAGRAKARGKRSFARQAPDVSLGRMHEEYLRSRRVENVRESTLVMYDGALRPWAAWCVSQGIVLVGLGPDQARGGVPAVSDGARAFRAHDPQPRGRH